MERRLWLEVRRWRTRVRKTVKTVWARTTLIGLAVVFVAGSGLALAFVRDQGTECQIANMENEAENEGDIEVEMNKDESTVTADKNVSGVVNAVDEVDNEDEASILVEETDSDTADNCTPAETESEAATTTANVEEEGDETETEKDYEIISGLSPDGITINLFDYWTTTRWPEGGDYSECESGRNDSTCNTGLGYTIEEKGINLGRTLKFSRHGGDLQEWNKMTNRSYATYPDIVSMLLSDGYPALNKNVVTVFEDLDEVDGGSLAYLFDPDYVIYDDAGESDFKLTFTDVKGLLQQNENGYYYSSDDNFAEFNEEENAFVLYSTPGVRGGTSNSTGSFFPFNTMAEDETATAQDSTINHYFGVTVTATFRINENEMRKFKFSGDDDVWIFVDGVLVGDVGGIHGNSTASIDFATGVVKINEGKTDTVNSEVRDVSSETTIKAQYEEAGVADRYTWDNNTYTSGTYHSLQMFYLERGNYGSHLQFTIDVDLIMGGQLELTKVSGNSAATTGNTGYSLAGAIYALYTDESCTEPATDVGGKAVVLTTDVDGKATSGNILPGIYYLKEITASKGYKLNSTVYTVEIENEETTTIESSELPITHQITTSADHCSISGNETDIPLGAGRTVTYAPESGYLLGYVEVDGERINIETFAKSYTFDNIIADHSVKAVGVQPEMSKTVTVDGQDAVGKVVNAGDQLTYFISYANPTTAAYTITITDTIPDGLTDCAAGNSGTVSGSTATWTIKTSAEQSGTVTLTCTVSTSAYDTILTNVAKEKFTPTNNESLPSVELSDSVSNPVLPPPPRTSITVMAKALRGLSLLSAPWLIIRLPPRIRPMRLSLSLSPIPCRQASLSMRAPFRTMAPMTALLIRSLGRWTSPPIRRRQ